VVQVSYRDALQYCKWVGGRLPTEAEWERAARGGLEGKTFVWGDEERPKGKFMANHWQGEFPGHDTGEDGFTQTSPVGSFAANGFNLYDMAGNVWEFTVDWYDPELYQAAAVAEALPPLKGYDPAGTGYGQRALRGGSWLCDQAYCFRFRPSARQGVDELTATNHTGFRVVWDEPAPEETSK
jgi:formylglycine-generating enzyme required for sulfatase activity